jgi:hypothetical protein
MDHTVTTANWHHISTKILDTSVDFNNIVACVITLNPMTKPCAVIQCKERPWRNFCLCGDRYEDHHDDAGGKPSEPSVSLYQAAAFATSTSCVSHRMMHDGYLSRLVDWLTARLICETERRRLPALDPELEKLSVASAPNFLPSYLLTRSAANRSHCSCIRNGQTSVNRKGSSKERSFKLPYYIPNLQNSFKPSYFTFDAQITTIFNRSRKSQHKFMFPSSFIQNM